jgi:HAD superfamily hydrolase (TIGR01548 family)
VSPNNPTGATIARAELRAVVAAAPNALIVVDAAYGEFASEDLTELALGFENAVVVRTFSKAWGLAGCRVGYVMGPAACIGLLRAAAPPYAVAMPSIALAIARLRDDGDAVALFVAAVRREVEVLREQLAGFGVACERSEANFVFMRTPRAEFLRAGLASFGIAVRTFPGVAALESAVRITCPGNAEWFARLQHAIATVFDPAALLFDVDGVLVDVEDSYRAAIQQTAAAFGVVVEIAEIRAAKLAGAANDDWELTARLIRAHGVAVDGAEVTAVFERLYQGDAEREGLRARERPRLEDAALRRLAKRHPLAIVTGRPRRDAEHYLATHAPDVPFGAVVCREDAPLKPDPAPVRVALAALGVGRAWFFGDTPDDVVAARRAGVLPIGVLSPGAGGTARDALRRAGAAVVIDDPQRLEELLP